MSLEPQRVGLFGGAFDPPHRAHRLLAEAALQQLGLDLLLVLPTGLAWHKTRGLTSAEHRMAMCECAFGDLARLRVDPRETLRQGPSYTADTLMEVAQEFPGAKLFLLIGADQLLAFKSWKRWQEVLKLADLVVAGRPPLDAGGAASHTDVALDLSAVDVPYLRLKMPLQNITATTVRERAGHDTSPAAPLALLVPDAVAGYISRHSLYQEHP